MPAATAASARSTAPAGTARVGPAAGASSDGDASVALPSDTALAQAQAASRAAETDSEGGSGAASKLPPGAAAGAAGLGATGGVAASAAGGAAGGAAAWSGAPGTAVIAAPAGASATGAAIPPGAVAEAAVSTPLSHPGFAPAFSARIAAWVRDGVEQARVRLNPLDMGPVAVQLALDGTQVRVDLAAEVAATRQLLEQSLPSLAGALREAGFTLSGGGVFQQSRQGFAEGGSDASPSRHGAGDEDTSATDPLASNAPVRQAASRGLVDVFA